MALTKYATRESLAGVFRKCVLSCALLSCALLASAPALAQEPSLWDKMMNTVGIGGDKEAHQPASAPVQAPQSSRSSAQAAQPMPIQTSPQAAAQGVQAPTQSPGMFDNILGKVGFGAKADPSSIDYSERQKLAVPQQRDLPPPHPLPERRVTRSADQEEALTKPPGDYLQKIPGSDGQISGLRDGDTAKDKKIFGLF